MLRSLRSRLILASVLWTAGLLALMHMVSLIFIRGFSVTWRIHPTGPVVLGLFLMILGLLVAQQGLTPFRRLREKLAGRRIDGAYPSEIQPLVDDLNTLLDDREKAVRRAIATAGDLAHGLKTPLALLAQGADRVSASGNPELAANITQQVERMSRQVDYHLARARAAASGASGAARCPITASVDALLRTVAKVYADKRLEISSHTPADLTARVQREDLDEILGNQLDNACKWARTKVALEASREATRLVIKLDDDGPGLARELRIVVLERGVRVDESAPGSGLGLAIVRDLTELYGGTITLEDSPPGGLGARVLLPS